MINDNLQFGLKDFGDRAAGRLIEGYKDRFSTHMFHKFIKLSVATIKINN